MRFAPANSQVEVRRATHDEVFQARQLRRKVLLAEGKEVSDSQVLPQRDISLSTIHVAAFLGTKLVGTVRLEPQGSDNSIYLVSRMVVDEDFRNQGIGAQVLSAAEDLAIDSGAKTFILDARPRAEQFYTRLGYVRSEGDLPIEPGEIPMTKQVKAE